MIRTLSLRDVSTQPLMTRQARRSFTRSRFRVVSECLQPSGGATVEDEESDPEELPGRPAGYTSQVALADPGCCSRTNRSKGSRATTSTVVASSRCSPTLKAPSCGLNACKASRVERDGRLGVDHVDGDRAHAISGKFELKASKTCKAVLGQPISWPSANL